LSGFTQNVAFKFLTMSHFYNLNSKYKHLIYKFTIIFSSLHTCIGFSYYTESYGNVTEAHLADIHTLNHTVWPLQTGYVGLEVQNLNQYVELFKDCLVNLQNYQGINLVGISSPVYISRFDVEIIRCIMGYRSVKTYPVTRYFEKHINRKTYCTSPNKSSFVNYEYKTTKPSWSCFAQFDLFHPEVHQAPHFFYQEATLFGKNIIQPYLYDYGKKDTGNGKIFVLYHKFSVTHFVRYCLK